MIGSNETDLDTDELMHLAIHSIHQNQTEKAISQLKQILVTSPGHGKAHYLLGALHAEIGLYDRAIDDMQNAVNLEPDLPTAHFQLGLLHLTSGRVAEAETAWQPLDKLGERDALFLFKRGMLNLAKDAFEDCIDDLQRGIALNTGNPDLNDDMQQVMESAQQALGITPDAMVQLSAVDSAINQSTDQPTVLSAYRRSNYEDL